MSAPHGEIARDALVFWERGRLIYNGALAAWCALLLALRYEAPPGPGDVATFLALCALVANLAYCAAYPLDLLAQLRGAGEGWRRARWAVLAAGTLGACMLMERLISYS